MDVWVYDVCKSQRDEKGMGQTPEDQEGAEDSNTRGGQGFMLLKEL